jgi:hypothetical protein
MAKRALQRNPFDERFDRTQNPTLDQTRPGRES